MHASRAVKFNNRAIIQLQYTKDGISLREGGVYLRSVPIESSYRRHPGQKRRVAKWVIWSFAALLCALILATGGISYYVGWHLTHPVRKPITETPAKYGLAYQSIHFTSRVDHVQLSGWLIPAASPSGKVVIEDHGYGENRSSEPASLPDAKALHNAGYTVLMFDFRDEGESAGKQVSVGLYEQRDLLGAVDYAKKLGYQHIGIIGYSMGASTALEVTAADSSVDATIADSPFSNLYQYLQGHMPRWTHLPNFPFTPEILWEMRVFDHINAHLVNPEKDLQHVLQRPILLIAGTMDKTVPLSNSKSLYKELKREHDKSASLWIVPGARHIRAYTVEPKRYESRIVRFFNTNL